MYFLHLQFLTFTLPSIFLPDHRLLVALLTLTSIFVFVFVFVFAFLQICLLDHQFLALTRSSMSSTCSIFDSLQICLPDHQLKNVHSILGFLYFIDFFYVREQTRLVVKSEMLLFDNKLRCLHFEELTIAQTGQPGCTPLIKLDNSSSGN